MTEVMLTPENLADGLYPPPAFVGSRMGESPHAPAGSGGGLSALSYVVTALFCWGRKKNPPKSDKNPLTLLPRFYASKCAEFGMTNRFQQGCGSLSTQGIFGEASLA